MTHLKSNDFYPAEPTAARNRRRQRQAFTLVELLAVITVIAILAGILLPVVFASLRRAGEFTVVQRVKEIEVAIDQFKTDHGFYPPVFGVDITGPGDMQRFLNRISPNHAEASTSFPGSSNSRLVDWWTQVGSNLDERTGLVFWLSGLCKNKQYPLTNGITVDSSGGTSGTMTIAAYDVNQYSDGSPFPGGAAVERDVRFEFKKLLPAGVGAIALQPSGDESGDLAFHYVRASSYNAGSVSGTGPDTAYFYVNAAGVPVFANPETFQIYCAGMDGSFGTTFKLWDETDPTFNLPAPSYDNVVNFANGTLSKYLNDNGR